MQRHVGARSLWAIVILIGYVSAMSAVWGYDMVACRGFVVGTVSALMRLAFLVFVSPSVLLTVLLLFSCCALTGYFLAALPVFRERRELLLLILPVATFMIGASAAASGAVPAGCSLAPWF